MLREFTINELWFLVLAARWTVLLSDDALARCHGQGNCTEVCPMELAPMTSILRLRRMGARRLLALG